MDRAPRSAYAAGAPPPGSNHHDQNAAAAPQYQQAAQHQASPSRGMLSFLRRGGGGGSDLDLNGRHEAALEDQRRYARSHSSSSAQYPPATGQAAGLVQRAMSSRSRREPGTAPPRPPVPDAVRRSLDQGSHRRSQSAPVTERSLNAPGVRSVKRGSWFNPEEETKEKREWVAKDKRKVVEWPEHNFEHFIIVGLPPTTELSSSPAAEPAAGSKGRESILGPSANNEHRTPHGEPLPGQILFSYPPDRAVDPAIVSYCFPHGVQPSLLERTPSMSALNELVYSQQYAHDDAVSFVFLQKVADNLPLYGVCCYMDEMVHRSPAVLASAYPNSNKPLSRYLVAAPRCYAFLTHFPFFSLHMKVLHMMLGLERMDRMRMFADELTAVSTARVPRPLGPASRRRAADADDDALSTYSSQSGVSGYRVAAHHQRAISTGAVDAIQAQAGRAEAAAPAPAPASGEESGLQKARSEDLDSVATLQRIAEALGEVDVDDLSEAGLLDDDLQRAVATNSTAGYAELTAMVRSTTLRGSGTERGRPGAERPPGEGEAAAGAPPPQLQRDMRSGSGSLRGVPRPPGSVTSTGSGPDAVRRASARIQAVSNPDLGRAASQQDDAENVAPAAAGAPGIFRTTSFEMPDEAAHAAEAAPSMSLDMTEPSTAMALKVMHSYYCASVPHPGADWEFRPDPSLQSVQYYRPKVGDLLADPTKPSQVSISTAEAEAAEGLCTWTVATLCRALSLPNILTLLRAVLLERPTVVICPNIGVLTSVVLALIPLMRPFAWQHLMMPVLPATEETLDILDAPFPVVLGIQHKTEEVAQLLGGLVRVNVAKDTIKNAGTLPDLPNDRLLMQKLQPSYNVLSNIGRRQAHGQPLYAVTGIQRTAAEGFLQNMRQYLSGLTANLAKHTITDVQHDVRVSLLLKDSFIESFAPKERPFIRGLVATQLFAEYCDAVIS